jgi:hypothetical protein
MQKIAQCRKKQGSSVMGYVNGRLDNIHIITGMQDYGLRLSLGSVWANPLLISLMWP